MKRCARKSSWDIRIDRPIKTMEKIGRAAMERRVEVALTQEIEQL